MSCGIKICGVTRLDDVAACRAAGVDVIGLNFWSGSKRVVTLEQAKRLREAARVPGTSPPLRVVGVFVDHSPAQVRSIVDRVALDYVQPHGDGAPDAFAALGFPWIWVVRGTPELASLRVPTPAPSWVLLDAHVAAFGGVGAQTDWAWAAEAVRALAPMPVWLAGGITPDNADRARACVAPAGLDVASGAESPRGVGGTKDAERIARLASICHNRAS